MKTKNKSGKILYQILIVEDSPTQAEKLKYILEKNQYRVMISRDGKEALNMVSEHNPDLIISDILMPEIDGYELCRKIKSDESTMDIPVIHFQNQRMFLKVFPAGLIILLPNLTVKITLFHTLNKSLHTGK
jgi:CheY-like chemotaxis protein